MLRQLFHNELCLIKREANQRQLQVLTAAFLEGALRCFICGGWHRLARPKALKLANRLMDAGIEVRGKTLRGVKLPANHG